MRRFFALLAFLFGAALAFGYPWLAGRLPNEPFGVFQAYSPAAGFIQLNRPMRPDEAPTEIYVDLYSSGSPKFGKDRAVLTLTISSGGKTVLAAPLGFEDAVARDDTPQTPEMIYRTRAGVIETVEPDAPPYTFTIDRGDADEIDIAKVDLLLQRAAQKVDPRAIPVGYIVMAIGAVLFLLSFRGDGSAPPANPNSQPPPPPPSRWGRGAADRR
jgi:hypothetical protein